MYHNLQADVTLRRCTTQIAHVCHMLYTNVHTSQTDVPYIASRCTTREFKDHVNTQRQPQCSYLDGTKLCTKSRPDIKRMLIHIKLISRWYQILVPNVHHNVNTHCLTTIYA